MSHESERLEELYCDHADDLLRFALRRTGSVEEAQEVVADTFSVCWRRIDSVPSDDARPWLYATAKNLILNEQRSNRRRRRLAARVGPDPASHDPQEGLTQGAEVTAALARLKPSHREVLALAYWEDLDAETAAKVLGCSKVAFNTKLHRARKAFERAMGTPDEGVNR